MKITQKQKYKTHTQKTLYDCKQCGVWSNWRHQYPLANWGHEIGQTGQAMCGIPVLSLERVNKPATKDNWLAYRHRSDRGREGWREGGREGGGREGCS